MVQVSIAEIIYKLLYELLCTYVGVYLSLKRVVYSNNSVIYITEIGETNPDTNLNNGLQCITDRMPCCRSLAVRAGEWYMYTPQRTIVPGPSLSVNFYRSRGYNDGTVNLNRNSGAMMPTGLFCCEVPNAAGDNEILCVYIGKRLNDFMSLITLNFSCM